MTELDPIEQEIIIETEKAIANLEALIKQTEDLRDHALLDVIALEALQAQINRLEGKTVDVDVRVRREAIDQFIREMEDASRVTERVFAVSGGGTTVEKSLDDIALAAARTADAQNELRYAQEQLGLSDEEFARLAHVSGDALFRQGEEARTKTDKIAELASKIDLASNAEEKAGRSFLIWGTGIRLTGYGLHWLIAGSAEFLAVVLPAMIAAADAAMVMAEGFTQVKDRFTAVYQATEATASMLHQTTGTVLGLHSALQQAQTTADPMVWELFGAGVNIARESFGGFWQQGLQVVHMLDTFAAHLDLSFGPGGALGGQVQTALHGMTGDLQVVGQLFGNLGHLLLSLATDMPGIAPMLFHLAAGVLGLANSLVMVAGPAVTAFMAIEEIGRWGGLAFKGIGPLVTGLGSMTGKLGAAAGSSRLFGSALKMVGLEAAEAEVAMVTVGAAAEAAGTEIAAAGTMTETFTGALMMPFMTLPGRILLGVVALAALIVAIQHSKDAAQQLGDTLESTIAGEAPAKAITTMVQGVSQLEGALKAANPTITQAATSFRYTGDSIQAANPQLQEYRGYISSLDGQLATVLSWNGKVGNSQYDLATAIGLATAAGVHMNQMFDSQGRLSATATQMIKNLITGYQMMAQTGTTLAQDINAINVQTLMQQTDVQKLNQAWDSFLTMVTGGTSALGSFNSDLSTIGNVALAATSKIQAFAQQAGGTALSVDQVAKSLQSFSATSAQVWQNYDAALTQAGQVTDWLRTAAAAGAVTAGQYHMSIKGIVSELLPFAKYSKTAAAELSALAEQAGGPTTGGYQALKEWIGNTNTAQKDLNGTVNSATQYMSNLGQVATNLATTLNSVVASALAQGAVNVKGITDAASGFRTQLATGKMDTFAFVGSVAQMTRQLLDANQPLNDVRSVMDQMASRAGYSSGQIKQLNTMINNLATALGRIHDVSATVSVSQVYTVSGQRIGPPVMPGGMATGGRVPGYGGGDKYPAMLEGGEAVVPKHLVPSVAPFLGAHGVPGFASGGIAGGAHGLTPMEMVIRQWAKNIWHADYRKYGESGPIPLNIMEQIFGPRKFGKTGMWKNPQYVKLVRDEQADMHDYFGEDVSYWHHAADIKNISASEKKQIGVWEKDIRTHYGAATEAKRMAQFRTELAAYEEKLAKEKDPYWRKIYRQDISRVEAELKAEPNYYKNKFLADIANLKKIDASKIFKDREAMLLVMQEMGYALRYSKGGSVPFGTYDRGGYLPTGLSLAMNGTGRPEPVGRGGDGVTHVHIEVGGREIANAIVPDMIGSVNRYTYRNSGRATGILRPS